MSDAIPPRSPRVDAGRPASADTAEARALMRRLHEASGQVDAVIDQLREIAALVRGDAPAVRHPPAREAPGLRRSTRASDPVRYDGDRRG
ncbi:hypothetical protein [Patulibacter minatonensis]|uniref:hypothetical protein n=1 Tax=Patulibacter minatonensis TaxID=298163 RepID=UPI00047B5573|nr:hypothetical protein [Patulibacter minatonensis]